MATRIAVCNHSPQMLNRFQTFLLQHRFLVGTFIQEPESLPALTMFAPDLILLGHIRGYPANHATFIERLRDHPVMASVPVVVCTTHEHLPDDIAGGSARIIPISQDALQLDHVLVGIRLALNMGWDDA